MDHHVSYMERAISCGRQSMPLSGVNPAVGAILVKDSQILGTGFHTGPGTAHAEIAAITDAIARSGNPEIARNATLYCTLEPCSHDSPTKKTPPCTDAIIKAGIARVFCACLDPNPQVNGNGIIRLRQAGIEVHTGLLQTEAEFLIERFSISIRENRPFVRLKWAQSIDGQIACSNGVSKWITPLAARAEAHELRANHDGVLVGMGTVRADDPELTVRLSPGRQPLRIVLAGTGGLPLPRRIFDQNMVEGTLVITTVDSPVQKLCAAQGIPVIVVAADAKGLPKLDDCLTALYQHGIGSLLVEGGSQILTTFIRSSFWDAATIFQAPILLGQGLPAIGATGVASPDLAPRLKQVSIQAKEGYCRIDGRRETNVGIDIAMAPGAREFACSPV